MKVGFQPPKAGAIRGVLIATEQNGPDSQAVPIEIAADFSGAGAAQLKAGPRYAPLTQPQATPATSLPVLILLAIMGGMILNLMPCVFPVLSIKAMGLVEQAKKHPAAVRAKGMVFAAGVISSMLCLAAALLIAARRRRRSGLGLSIAVAAVRHFDGLLVVRGGLESLGRLRNRRRTRRRWRRPYSGRRLPRLVLHRGADDSGGDTVYGAVHGCRGRRRPHAVGAG